MKPFLAKMKRKMEVISTTIERVPAYTVSQMVEFPIYIFDLDTVDTNDIIESTSKYTQGQSYRTDVVKDGFQSQYFSKSEILDFKSLVHAVENKANSISTVRFAVDHFWFVVYKKNSEQVFHSHKIPGNYRHQLAAVYYPLDVESSPIVFKNSNDILKIFPKKNQLLIFDSRLQHSVPKCQTDQPRMAFAFNLIEVQ